MFTTICQFIGLIGLLACLALATLGMNKNRKSRQMVRRMFRRMSLDK